MADGRRAPAEQDEGQRADGHADRGQALGAEAGDRDGQEGGRRGDAEQPAKAPPPDEFGQPGRHLEGEPERAA